MSTPVIEREEMLNQLLQEMEQTDPEVAFTPVGIDSEGYKIGEDGLTSVYELWMLNNHRGEILL